MQESRQLQGDGWTYTGEINSAGLFDGYGKKTWDDGNVYEGEFKGGYRDGLGKFTWADGSVYEGEFKGGYRDGLGRFTWADGSIYEGEWSANNRTGQGTFRWPDGDVYEGEFLNDRMHGKGAIIDKDGIRKEGQFEDGKSVGDLKKVYPRLHRQKSEVFNGDISETLAKASYPYNSPEAAIEALGITSDYFAENIADWLAKIRNGDTCAANNLLLFSLVTNKEIIRNSLKAIVFSLPPYKDITKAHFFAKRAIEVSNDETIGLPRIYYEDAGLYSLSLAHKTKFKESPVDDLLSAMREQKDFRTGLVDAIASLERLQEAVLKKNNCRTVEEYFQQKHGIDDLDFTNEDDRFELRQKIENRKKPDDIILSMDASVDFIYPNHTQTLAYFFYNTNYYTYDPELARKIMMFNVILGAGISYGPKMSSFWLGHQFNNGDLGRVDHNAALFWFEIAGKLGHGMSYTIMRSILINHDERAENQNDAEFKAHLDDLMKKAEESKQPCVANIINTRYAFGLDPWNDQERVLKHYEDMIEKDFWGKPQTDSLLAYALRSLVLRNTERTAQDLMELLLQKSREDDGSLSVYYESNYLINVNHIKRIFARNGIDFDNNSPVLDEKYQHDFWATCNAVRDSYKRDIPILQGLYDLTHPDASLEAIRDALWISKTLSSEEGWFNKYDIYRAFEIFNAVCLGLDLQNMKRSALIMGPFYNRISPRNALPILGAHLSASESPEQIEQQKLMTGSYAPMPGVIKLRGLTAVFGGGIYFDCENDDDAPAMLVPEDFQVAMALVFGRPHEVIEPSLSLEKKDKELLPDDFKMFKAKIWNPAWLGHTDMGKTFYIVDRLTGQMTWNPHSYEIAQPEECFHPEFSAFTKALVEDLRFTGGADKTTQGKRIFVSPENVPIPPLLKTFDKEKGEIWKLTIGETKMRINGAYIHEVGDVEDRSIGLNDIRFGQGRLTQRLTDHYNDIGLMMPVFERGRQLATLLYALKHLKGQGFKLGSKEQSDASHILAQYEALPPVPREELVMKAQPFRLDLE